MSDDIIVRGTNWNDQIVVEINLHDLSLRERNAVMKMVRDGVITDKEIIQIMALKIPGLIKEPEEEITTGMGIFKTTFAFYEHSGLKWTIHRHRQSITFWIIVGSSILSIILYELLGRL
jgi:hypothetical protein